MKSKTLVGQLREQHIGSAIEAVGLFRRSGLPLLTEARLYKVESGRYQPTPEEARVLSLAFNAPVFVLFPQGVKREVRT